MALGLRSILVVAFGAVLALVVLAYSLLVVQQVLLGGLVAAAVVAVSVAAGRRLALD